MENNQNVCLAALTFTIFAHRIIRFFFPRELSMAWQSVDSFATKLSQVSFLVGLFRTVFMWNELANWESIRRQFYCVWLVLLRFIVPGRLFFSFLNQLRILWITIKSLILWTLNPSFTCNVQIVESFFSSFFLLWFALEHWFSWGVIWQKQNWLMRTL